LSVCPQDANPRTRRDHPERDVKDETPDRVETDSRDPPTPRTPAEAWPLLKGAVEPILERNEEARTAFEALRKRGLTEEAAREEIARVLLAVMFHVGAGSEMLARAGGGAGLRSAAFQRLAAGETARQIFESGPDEDG